MSARLVDRLSDLFPASSHVTLVDLQTADDSDVWRFAAENDFVILSKDEDFHQRSFLYGPPPKVIWVRLGNCTTDAIEQVIRTSVDVIAEFQEDSEAAFLVLDAAADQQP